MVSSPPSFNLKPVRLQRVKAPSGPYTRLLRRPGPEVVALGGGMTSVVLRGTRILHTLPLWASEKACYYAAGGIAGWRTEDFIDDKWVQSCDAGDADHVEFLAVPVAHLRLANDGRVDAIAEALSPWKGQAIERWRRDLKGAIWLTVVRVYSFATVAITLRHSNRLHATVRPFRARSLQPVIHEAAWAQKILKIQDVLNELSTGKSSRGLEKPAAKMRSYTIKNMSRETGLDECVIKKYQRLLWRKKQLVFYGPPGTGKTYIAEKLAQTMIGDEGGFSETVQFHPSYAYEDFVQGLRPQTRGGNVVYELVEGAFLRFCKKAKNVATAPCVLLIDELNRAPLARVLGELLYLLEYRHKAVVLSGGGDEFSIPDNVYIIGTMNAADKSIALVDQAIIRRFSFVHLLPNYKILAQYLSTRGLNPTALIALLEEINEEIGDEDQLLGTSFFMQDESELPERISDIWQGEIEPYLKESLFDRPKELNRYLWDGGVKSRLDHWET